MQAFLSSVTAAILFIHTVFGCCWHHAHGSTAAISEPARCCHHHQHSNDSKPQQKPCKCNVECESACTYIVPQKVIVEAPQCIAFDLLAVLPSLAGRQMEVAASWQGITSPSDTAPPVRTHLLHQVFLN
jgi:hypothetical protein